MSDAQYYMNKNFLKAQEEADAFKFNGMCNVCGHDMTEFSSDDKSIFMCETCWCIYLPENMRNIKPSNYKYKKHIGIFEPLYLEPTQNQLAYLYGLAKAANVVIDYDITKEEARAMINELKSKVGSPNIEVVYANDIDEAYTQNHQYDEEMQNSM